MAYSSFSDVYQTIMYESNFAVLKIKNNEVSCEIFTKIGNDRDSIGLMKNVKDAKNNYLIYPYVVSKNTKINNDGCNGLEFVFVPYSMPNYVVGFIEGGLLSKNKMVLMKMKKDVNLSKMTKITSYKDIIDEKDYQKDAKIFFSGELNNKIVGAEYSYLKVSDKMNSDPLEKIGFTPFGNFSLNKKLVPCVKDYCNFFFLPINDKEVKIGQIEPLSQGSYKYAGITKIAPIVGVVADIASVVTGSLSSSRHSSKDLKLHETKINALPICFGYKNMPVISDLAGGYYQKYVKYMNKLEQMN
jgi:hypothetical protein